MPSTQSALLAGLKVIDCGVGMAAALAAKFLADLGAEVHRVPPPLGDPFFDVYPAYGVWRRQEIVHEPVERIMDLPSRLLADADVCIVGGEDYPGLKCLRDTKELTVEHPRLIVLEISGYPSSAGYAPVRAVDILAQARTGIGFELHDDKPILMSFQPANYGVLLQGLIGIGAALFERERSGRGQVVAVSMVEGALNWVQPMRAFADNPTPKFQFLAPKRALPLILKCQDGVYIHIVLGALGSKSKLYGILNIDDPAVGPNDSGMPNPKDAPEKYFGDVGLLKSHVSGRNSAELLSALWDAGVVAEAVLSPGACWDDPQVRHNCVIADAPDGSASVGNPITWKASPAPRKAPLASSEEPLRGIKVIDFGAFVAGPTASVALADLGADVIKVEPPEGDPMRAVHRFYAAANRGKRTVVIDMKTSEGIAVAHRLCEQADVVCSNFRAGVAARLGIDSDHVHARQPGTVVLNNAGYGTSGPKARTAAFDPALQAVCGHEMRAGGVDNPPLMNLCAFIDFAGGQMGTAAVLMALHRRARTGDGAELAVPLLNAGIYLLSELIRQPDGTFVGADPIDADQTGYHPAEKFYRTRDGWLAICARTEATARNLATALGIDDRVRSARAQWGRAEAEIIAAAIRIQTSREASRKLEQAGVWTELCRKDGEDATVNDAALNERGTIYRAEHKGFGWVRGLGPLFDFSRSRRVAKGDTAGKGQHTREILLELGYAPAEIEAMYARKIVA